VTRYDPAVRGVIVALVVALVAAPAAQARTELHVSEAATPRA
jgi:hypothetical protein